MNGVDVRCAVDGIVDLRDACGSDKQEDDALDGRVTTCDLTANV